MKLAAAALVFAALLLPATAHAAAARGARARHVRRQHRTGATSSRSSRPRATARSRSTTATAAPATIAASARAARGVRRPRAGRDRRGEGLDLVGHSQGGMMPRYYVKNLGGAAKVDDLIGLSPSNHGTTTRLGARAAPTRLLPRVPPAGRRLGVPTEPQRRRRDPRRRRLHASSRPATTRSSRRTRRRSSTAPRTSCSRTAAPATSPST